MRRPRSIAVVFVLSAGAAILSAGCRSISSGGEAVKDVAPSRKARQAETAGDFTQKRDMAELLSAQECQQRGDLVGCRTTLESLVRRNPEHLEGHLMLAETLMAQDRAPEAIGRLQPLAERHPGHARLQHTMGLLWDNAGETKRALSYYQRAAEQEPDNELYARSYQTAARAVAASPPARGEPGDSGSGPTGSKSAGTQLVIHEESVGKPDSAARSKDIRPAEAMASDEGNPRLNAALEVLRRGSAGQALPMLQEVIAANPKDPQIPISAAVAALQCNQPDVAIALVKPALNRFPNAPALHRILGTAQYRRGDYAASQIALQQALSLDKSNALSYFLMGCTLSKLGQGEAAEEYFRLARTMDPRFAVQP